MNLVLLSGNSFSHKKWIEEVAGALEPLVEEIHIQYYQHWETGDEIILMEEEAENLREAVEDLSPYLVFGKSAGTLLALKGVHEGFLTPEKCILVGLPVEWARTYDFDVDLWTRDFSVPTLFIQKEQDPVLHFDELSLYLEKQKVRNYQTVELEGDSHYYGELELLKNLIWEFSYS